MLRCSALAMLIWHLCGSVATATAAADWARSFGEFHLNPAITGRICALAGDLVYAAGDELVIADQVRCQIPCELGRVVLSGTAVDIALAGTHVLVACGDGGLVDVDVSDPRAPFVVHRYDPMAAITAVAPFGSLVAVADDQRNLVLLVPGAEGQFQPIVTWQAPFPIWDLAPMNGNLLLLGSTYLSILDLSRLDSPRVVTNYEYGWWSSPAWARFHVDGTRVYVHYVEVGSAEYGPTSVTTTLRSLSIPASGQVQEIAHVVNLGDSACASAAAESRLVTLDNHSVILRAGDDLTVLASAPFGASGVPGSIATDGRSVARVGTAGLGVMHLPTGADAPRAVPLRGDLNLLYGPGYDSQTTEAFWAPPLGVLMTRSHHESYDGVGYEDMVIDYELVYERAGADLVSCGSGHLTQSINHEYTWSGFPGFAAFPVGDRRAIVVWPSVFGFWAYVRDLESGTCLGTISGSELSPCYDYRLVGTQLWCSVFGGPIRYDLASATPLAPLPTWQLPYSGLPWARDAHLAVFFDAAAGQIAACDVADPDNVRLLSILPLAANHSAANGIWVGDRFVYGAPDGLYALDYSDPARPVALGNLAPSSWPVPCAISGDRFAVKQLTAVGAVTRRGIRLVEMPTSGPPVVHGLLEIPIEPGAVALSGDVLYVGTARSVTAYDVSDPERAVSLGSARGGIGNMAVVGERLMAGATALPRDRRDLKPPRQVEIVVDATPLGPPLIPVVVRAAPGFDPTTLDPATVRFGPAQAPPCAAPPDKRRSSEAPDLGSAAVDLTLWFEHGASGIAPGTSLVRLTGRTTSGESIAGEAWLGNRDVAGQIAMAAEFAATPNPFNPQTLVSFGLAESAEVRLGIYDLRGRCVRHLLDGRQPAGIVRSAWDGTDEAGAPVASGVYLAHVATDRGSRSLRLVLVR